MGFITNNYLELFRLNDFTKLCRDHIAHNENASIRVKILSWFLENLDLIRPQILYPLEELVTPWKFKWSRSDNQNWPVSWEQVSDWDCLNSFSHTHFITQQNSSKVINPKLDTNLLKIVKWMHQAWWQLTQRGPHIDIQAIVILDQIGFCVIWKWYPILNDVKSNLRYRVQVGYFRAAKLAYLDRNFFIFVETHNPFTVVEIVSSSMFL